MRKIFKFEINPPRLGESVSEVMMPGGVEGVTVLSAGTQNGVRLMVWAVIEDPKATPKPVAFKVYGTGHGIDTLEKWEFVNTVFMGPLVWHVFVEEGAFRF